LRKGIYIIPNSITLCGMTLGFYSILSSLKGASTTGAEAMGHFAYAAWAILFANICDALDGWVARLTNSTSKFGLQLDSLSDMLTFGTAPAILIFCWGFPELRPHRLAWAVSLFFVLCAALRLARFNVQMDTVESRSFTGMPTPSAATILTSGILVCIEEPLEYTWLPYVFLGLVFLLGLLMVSNVRYHSLKELNKLKKKPFWVLVVVAVMVLLLLVNPPNTIFIASSLYLLSGLIEAPFALHRKRPPAAPPAIRPAGPAAGGTPV
jgi:CDP-diacylglycerol--serine O-phosphatidyltransferase